MNFKQTSGIENHQEPLRDFRIAIIGPTGSGKTGVVQQLALEALIHRLPLRTLSLSADLYSEAILYGGPVPSLPIESLDLVQRWHSPEQIVHGVSDRLDIGDLSRFSSEVPVVMVIDSVGDATSSKLPSCGGGLLLQTFQHPESVPFEMQPDGFLIQIGNAGTWTFRYAESGKGRKTAQRLRLDEIVNRVLCRQPLDLADTPYRNCVDAGRTAATLLANCTHKIKFSCHP